MWDLFASEDDEVRGKKKKRRKMWRGDNMKKKGEMGG